VKSYHVYIMSSASRVLYIGVTGDLLRRVMEHKQMRISGFTARYHVTELVYFEAFGDIRRAGEADQGMVTGEEDCVDRVFQSALAGLGCGTTVACAQPCVILSEAKNLSVSRSLPSAKPRRDSSLRSE